MTQTSSNCLAATKIKDLCLLPMGHTQVIRSNISSPPGAPGLSQALRQGLAESHKSHAVPALKPL